jgi:flavin-dependent dehydrogenase
MAPPIAVASEFQVQIGVAFHEFDQWLARLAIELGAAIRFIFARQKPVFFEKSPV